MFWTPCDQAATSDARLIDFRLLRHDGFYRAADRYGPDVRTPFTYACLHATEWVLKREEQNRLWGVNCYSLDEHRNLRIGNRLFHQDPDQGDATLVSGGASRRRLNQGKPAHHLTRRREPECFREPAARVGATPITRRGLGDG